MCQCEGGSPLQWTATDENGWLLSSWTSKVVTMQTHHMHPILIWAKWFTLKIHQEAYLYFSFSHTLIGDINHSKEQYVLCKHIALWQEIRGWRLFCTQKNKLKLINKSTSVCETTWKAISISDVTSVKCSVPPTCYTTCLYLGWVWYLHMVLIKSLSGNMSQNQLQINYILLYFRAAARLCTHYLAKIPPQHCSVNLL